MILVDTSAWIEFLRNTGSTVCDQVEALLTHEVAICDAVRMEVLSGARDEFHLLSLQRLLARGNGATHTGDGLRRCRRTLSPLPSARRDRPEADRLPHCLHCHTRAGVYSAQRRRL